MTPLAYIVTFLHDRTPLATYPAIGPIPKDGDPVTIAGVDYVVDAVLPDQRCGFVCIDVFLVPADSMAALLATRLN